MEFHVLTPMGLGAELIMRVVDGQVEIVPPAPPPAAAPAPATPGR